MHSAVSHPVSQCDQSNRCTAFIFKPLGISCCGNSLQKIGQVSCSCVCDLPSFDILPLSSLSFLGISRSRLCIVGIQLTLRGCRFDLSKSTSTILPNILSLPYEFLSNISAAYSIVREQYIIHITYKAWVNQLFTLSVRVPVNSGLLVVNFGGSQKLYMDIQLCRGVGTPTATWSKGRL